MATWIYTLCLLIFSASAASLAWSSEKNSNKSCLQKCEITLNGSGLQEVRCFCNHTKKKTRYWGNDGRPINESDLSKKLKFFSLKSKNSILSGDCKSRLKNQSYELKNTEEFKELISVATLSVCECVENRVRFPVYKKCSQNMVGEKFCTFNLSAETAPATYPIREVNLADFQACETKKNNYRKPASCLEASCQASFPQCTIGYEAYNVAESGSCCPKYFCRKVNTENLANRKK